MPPVLHTAKLICAAGLLVVSCAAQAIPANEIVLDGYGFTVPANVASGQIVTLSVKGVTVSDADATFVPLPISLSGLAVSVKSNIPGYPTYLPLLHLRSLDFCAGRYGVSCPLTYGDGSPLSDGTLSTPGTIATAGETVVLYAVGLGRTTPPVSSGMGSPNPAATIDPLNFPLVFSHQIVFPNAPSVSTVFWSPVPRLVYPTYIGLVPNYVGLYQINVVVPSELGQVSLPVYNTGCPVNVRIAIGAGQNNSTPIDGASFINLCLNE